MLFLENIKKTNFKEKSKTTSALTCLIGAVLLFNQTANAATSGANMSVTTSVAAYCTVTATDLTFAAFINDGGASAINSTGGGVVSTNCSIGTSHTLSVTTAQTGGVYIMTTGNASDDTKKINFKLYNATNGVGEVLNSGNFRTATGDASTNPVATLFGQIVGSQSGKVAGAYTSTIALLATFN
jgi:spore coat protein U-like protein